MARLSAAPAFCKSKLKRLPARFPRAAAFLLAEDGPTAVEYAVMLALILVACISTVQTLGTGAEARFAEISGYL